MGSVESNRQRSFGIGACFPAGSTSPGFGHAPAHHSSSDVCREITQQPSVYGLNKVSRPRLKVSEGLLFTN